MKKLLLLLLLTALPLAAQRPVLEVDVYVTDAGDGLVGLTEVATTNLATNTVARVKGTTTIGDGGAQDYLWNGSAWSAIAGTAYAYTLAEIVADGFLKSSDIDALLPLTRTGSSAVSDALQSSLAAQWPAAIQDPNIINVATEFGATADDLIDDTTALQSAVAAAKATQRPLFFPPGNYLVSGTLVLDWEGATILGASCGLTGSIITTTSTADPVFSVPGDYNNIQICNLRIVGPGRATSNSSAIYFRGDLEGASNIDFSTLDKVVVVGFQTGFDSTGFANSSVYNFGTTDCSTGVELKGNSNSVSFSNCAFVCTDGAATGTQGLNLAASCNGIVISSCDAGGPTLEWCIWDEGISTTVIGGQWEAYHSGIYSINGLNMSGTYVRDYGAPSTTRYSVRTNQAAINACRLSVKTSGTESAMRIDSTATRLVYVTGDDAMRADYYTSGGAFSATGPVLNIPTNIGNSGEAASLSNHGAWWRRSTTGIDDSWSVVVKDSGDNYETANLFAYHFDTQNNGAPAYVSGSNTFTGSITRITRSTNPGLSITTETYTTGSSQSGLFISTASNNIATNSAVDDTVLVAKSGNSLLLATGASSTAQVVQLRIPSGGILTYANTAAASGLVSKTVFKVSNGDGTSTLHIKD